LAKTIKHRPVNALILLYYPWRLSLGLSLQPSPWISRAHLVQKSMWALTDTDIAAIFIVLHSRYSVLCNYPLLYYHQTTRVVWLGTHDMCVALIGKDLASSDYRPIRIAMSILISVMN